MEKELSELNDQELLEKKRKFKSNEILNAVILGVLVGISIYSAATEGFGLFTVLPLVFVGLAVNSWNKNKKALEKELISRNLK
jgi:hypothetical protein